MTGFRLVLLVMTAIIVVFTITAIADGGLDLLTPYLRVVLAMNWQGQFNIDFACYLVLSGIWMSWRSGFTHRGIALGVCAPVLGILFLAPYLIYLVGKSGGDARKLLLGVHAQ